MRNAQRVFIDSCRKTSVSILCVILFTSLLNFTDKRSSWFGVRRVVSGVGGRRPQGGSQRDLGRKEGKRET